MTRRERAAAGELNGIGKEVDANGLHEIIRKEICSRNNICGWPQPTGREAPITAAPDRVEPFQELGPGG